MQDQTSEAASAYYHQDQSMMMMMKQPELLQPEQQEQLKCPRCDSANTKFCYYNNYNLSQPRHFCKNCRRYWTKGGSLRNIPVGGGIRKTTKRSAGSSSSASSSSNLKIQKPSSESDLKSGSGSGSKLEETGQGMDPTRMLYGLPVGDPTVGSFSSLLASSMQMGGGIMSGTGSGWIAGMGLDSGFQGSDDKWTDLTMNRVEEN